MWEWLEFEFLSNTVWEYIIFLALFVLGFAFKRQGTKLIASVAYRILGKYKGTSRFSELVGHIKGPFETLIFVLILYTAIFTLDAPYQIEEHNVFLGFVSILDYVFKIVIVFVVLWFIYGMLDFIAISMVRQQDPDIEEDNRTFNQAIPFIKDIFKIFLLIITFIFILGVIFKVNVTSLIAGLGIGGLAIALAAQETLANLLASFTIFIDKPFTTGDFIQVGDILGTVEDIGLRSTRIRTLEKSYLSVPNKNLVNSTVDNLSLRTYRRAKFSVGVTYQTTSDQIKNIVADIKKMLDEHPNTTNDSVVRFESFGESSLNILLNFFVDTMNWDSFMTIREEINFSIMEIVEKHGSSIAFPTRTVHVYKEKDYSEYDDNSDENRSSTDN